MIDVMFFEVFKEEEAAIKKYLPDNISAQYTSDTIQEYDDQAFPCDLISIRTQSVIPDTWGNQVKGILTRSQGYDHLIGYQRESNTGRVCGYLNNYCARAVAEQAIGMMLALLRKFKKQTANFNSFNRNDITGYECRGRHVLVVGVGNIGSEIVDIGRGLRMETKGFDIVHEVKDLSYVSLEEGIPWADVVFCALTLTDETNKLLCYDVLKNARPGFIFVNVARGEISPAEDLKSLLKEGILGGLGLDVFPQEASLANSLRAGLKKRTTIQKTLLELYTMEQVMFTPHNAFNTQEALELKASLSAKAVVHYLKNKTFPCLVPSL